MPTTCTLDDLRLLLIRCAELPPGLVLDDPTTSMLDLGVDSVALVALHAELTQRDGVRIGQSALPALRTAGGTVELVDRPIRPGAYTRARVNPACWRSGQHVGPAVSSV